MTAVPSPAIPRTALVTGAAHRIGRAIALDLAAQGFDVAIHYNRSRDAAEALAADIESAGRRAALLDADLSVEAHTAALIRRAAEALGPVGCLVNNASRFDLDVWDTTTRESWDVHMETNLRAPFLLSQDMARGLPETAEGVIVNLIDQRVWNLTPYFLTYTLSKTGLWTLTQTLALALAPRIRVNAVGPGPTLKSERQSQKQFRMQWDTTPLQHGATPEEIAAGVRYILAAPSMTGQMIALDGGEHLGWAQPARGVVPVE
ncbi:MAG: SDR family oxidoreductase [Alphaproteobacteria bacterium]|nr:SDR family oxidoreductase [Alphaproteobacteria bacterium]